MESESIIQPPQPCAAAQYSYFDRSFKIELAMFAIFVPAIITLWAITAYACYYYNGHILITLVKISTYFTIAMVFTLIFYGNARTLTRYKAVIVEKDRVVKKSARGINALNCAEISGIRPLKIPFIKRWAVLESPNRWFLLPLKVRNGHEMVEKIFGNIAERGTILQNSAKIKEKLCAASRRFNVLHDMRIQNMPNLLWAVTIAALFNGAVAHMYWERGLIMTLAWGFVGMLFQIETYFWAERFHLKSLLRGRDDVSAVESLFAGYKGYYVLAGVVGILLTMAASVFVTNPM